MNGPTCSFSSPGLAPYVRACVLPEAHTIMILAIIRISLCTYTKIVCMYRLMLMDLSRMQVTIPARLHSVIGTGIASPCRTSLPEMYSPCELCMIAQPSPGTMQYVPSPSWWVEAMIFQSEAVNWTHGVAGYEWLCLMSSHTASCV